MRRTSVRVLAVLAGLSLVAAACGDDDDEAGDTSTTEDTTASTVADYTLDAPVKIVALISDPGGADQNAVPDFNDGIRMAVEEINAAGGIGGHPVELQVVETLPTGDSVVNSLNLALNAQPTALLGPVSSSAILAMAERVDQAGIPLIHNTTEPAVALDGEAGSQWIFANRPSNAEAAAAGTRFAVEELGAESLGLLHTNTAFGESGAAAQKAEAEELGVEVDAERAFEFNATDLTEAVTAMSDVDAILDWGTPSTVGLARNTLAQQGLLDIPHIGPGSVGFGFFAQIVGDESVLEGMYGVIDCNPADDDRDEAQDWVERFEEEEGYAPSYATAEMYDSVYVLKAVIDEAQSSAPEAIRDGLNGLEGYEGICTTYTNENNLLHQTSVVARFEDGQLVTQEEFDFAG